MKKTFLFLGFLFAVIGLQAQEAATKSKHEFSIWGAGGLSSLYYNPTFGERTAGFGGGFGLGYAFFFNQNFGILTGGELAFYNTTMKVNGLRDYVIDESVANNYYTISGYEESQRMQSVNIPLSFQYQTGETHKFYASLGFKLGIPLSGSYEVTNGKAIPNRTTQPSLDLTSAKKDLEFDLSYMGTFEAGVKWRLSRAFSLYTGAYAEYGFNDLVSTHTDKFIAIDNRNSVLTSEYTRNGKTESFASNVSPLAIGVKVRLAAELLKKDTAEKETKKEKKAQAKAEKAKVKEAKAQEKAAKEKEEAAAKAKEEKAKADAAAKKKAEAEKAKKTAQAEQSQKDVHAARRTVATDDEKAKKEAERAAVKQLQPKDVEEAIIMSVHQYEEGTTEKNKPKETVKPKETIKPQEVKVETKPTTKEVVESKETVGIVAPKVQIKEPVEDKKPVEKGIFDTKTFVETPKEEFENKEVAAAQSTVKRSGVKSVVTIEVDGYGFNQNSLSQKMELVMNDEIAYIKSTFGTDVQIIIEGHTQDLGDPEHSMKEGLERANVIRNYMIYKGFSADKVEAVSKGATLPIASNDTEEGRKKNQRIVIVVK